MRQGEAHGINYYYYTTEQFAQKIVDGEMLECAIFNDWCYGTSYDSLRSDGVINIGVFKKGNIKIQYLDANGNQIQLKDKTWDGFLNNNNGQGFCQGIKGDEQYSNDIEPDTYRNFTNAKESNTFKKASYVKVTVKKDGVEYSKTVKISNK
jgi:hypothetical protein